MEWNGMESIVSVFEVSRGNWYKSKSRIHNNRLRVIPFFHIMKFFETHFNEYVKKVEEYSLHPIIKKTITTFPVDIQSLPSMIMYGPCGVGKYSHALYMISRYSPSHLKYEKRIAVAYNKDTFFIKISDCHFEVDMSLLGCNSKHLWNEIYNQIQDIVSSRSNTTAFVMCKNFHRIHSELLETFYSYMSDNLKFVILSEHVSFLPDNILHRCKLIPFKRPTATMYNKCIFPSSTVGGTAVKKGGKQSASASASASLLLSPLLSHSTEIIKETPIRLSSKFPLETITNIKALKSNMLDLTEPHENICNCIVEIILSPDAQLKYDALRERLYDLLTYDINIQECVWFILRRLITNGSLLPEMMDDIMIQIYTFFQYFNNNYRPIYHLENFVLLLVCKIHGYKHQFPSSPPTALLSHHA
jgi:hypothetical protein